MPPHCTTRLYTGPDPLSPVLYRLTLSSRRPLAEHRVPVSITTCHVTCRFNLGDSDHVSHSSVPIGVPVFLLIVRLKSSLVFLLSLGHSGFLPGSPPAVLLRLLHDRTPVCHLVSVYSYVLTRSSTSLPYIKARAVPTVPQFEYLVAPHCTLYFFAQLIAPLARTSHSHRSSICALSEIQRH